MDLLMMTIFKEDAFGNIDWRLNNCAEDHCVILLWSAFEHCMEFALYKRKIRSVMHMVTTSTQVFETSDTDILGSCTNLFKAMFKLY